MVGLTCVFVGLFWGLFLYHKQDNMIKILPNFYVFKIRVMIPEFWLNEKFNLLVIVKLVLINQLIDIFRIG